MKPGDTVTCTVEAVDDEGRGRAVAGDLDVAIRGALPGDVARCKIERIWPSHGIAQARALELVRESDLHVDRDCPHAAPCAGCPMQGVQPEFALAWKKARVERALSSAGIEATVQDVEPSRAPRQKAKLAVETGRVGLFVPHTHIPVDATSCPYHHPLVNDALAKLAPVVSRVIGVKAVIVRAYQEGVGVVVVADMPIASEDWPHLTDLVDQRPIVSLSLRLHVDGSANSVVAGDIARFVGPRALTPLEGGAPVDVDAFCQPDPKLATWMYQRVASFISASDASPPVRRLASSPPVPRLPPPVPGLAPGRGRYADLYAGTGGFSRALLDAGCADIVAVERARSSVAALEALPVEVYAGTVEDALPLLAQHNDNPELPSAPPLRERAAKALEGIIVDPPKAGLGVLAPRIADLRAKRVAIVACDPDAGARDARLFIDEGYRLVSVEPLDLFPGSMDVETLFLLELPP